VAGFIPARSSNRGGLRAGINPAPTAACWVPPRPVLMASLLWVVKEFMALLQLLILCADPEDARFVFKNRPDEIMVILGNVIYLIT
jgi:hypothetical protein